MPNCKSGIHWRCSLPWVRFSHFYPFYHFNFNHNFHFQFHLHFFSALQAFSLLKSCPSDDPLPLLGLSRRTILQRLGLSDFFCKYARKMYKKKYTAPQVLACKTLPAIHLPLPCLSSATYPVDIGMSFTKIIIDWFNSSYLYLL